MEQKRFTSTNWHRSQDDFLSFLQPHIHFVDALCYGELPLIICTSKNLTIFLKLFLSEFCRRHRYYSRLPTTFRSEKQLASPYWNQNQIYPFFEKLLKRFAKPCTFQGCRSRGVPGVPWHPQILTDQLTLSQPRLCPPNNTGTPGFLNLSYGLAFFFCTFVCK